MRFLIVFLLSSSFFAGFSNAATTAQIRSLKGVRGICTFVESIDDDRVKGVGVNPAIIQSAVEAQLRNAHIPLMTSEEYSADPKVAALEISVNVVTIDLRGVPHVVYSIDVNCRQITIVDHNAAFVATPTWTTSNCVGIVALDKFKQTLIGIVTERATTFANDLAKANK